MTTSFRTKMPVDLNRAAAFTEPPFAVILSFGSPLRNKSGRVDFLWQQPGDALPIEMQVQFEGDPARLRAEIWTNANHNANPHHYESLAMSLHGFEWNTATFRIDLPILCIGNYRIAGRIYQDGCQTCLWTQEQGLEDICVRPRRSHVDALNIEQVSIPTVNCKTTPERVGGTFADMMDHGSPLSNGLYTLEWMASQGKNAILLLPITEARPVLALYPDDDLPSPYAVSNFFAVDPRLARGTRGLQGDEARLIAAREFTAFVEKAHTLGIKVILDLPLNHIGCLHEFHDLFVTCDEQGQEHREVRHNDFSQMSLNLEQHAFVQQRLEDPSILHYLEFLAPWFYASEHRYPQGASHWKEIAPGGWGEWRDTQQLNHGRRRVGFREWVDCEITPEQYAIHEWLSRAMRYWAVDMGVDGFRIDHVCGLHPHMLELALNLLQADVDVHRPGCDIIMIGEDFDTSHTTQHWVDILQAGWFRELLYARRPDEFRSVLENPWFCHLLNLCSHDEDRLFNPRFGDVRRALRMGCLMYLLGGPLLEVVGDHFGETKRMEIRRYDGIQSLQCIDSESRHLAEIFGRMGRTRRNLSALHGKSRAWLTPCGGDSDPDILALARHPSQTDAPLVFVFCNLDNYSPHTNQFKIDDRSKHFIEPSSHYQVRNLNTDDDPSHLWDRPRNGSDLLVNGIYVALDPYELQLLLLEKIN